MEDIVQPALAAAGTKGIAVQACDACRRLKVGQLSHIMCNKH